MMDWRKPAEYLQKQFIRLPTNDSSRYRCKCWSVDRPGPSASTCQPESSSDSLGYSADFAAASLLPFSADAEVNISSTVALFIPKTNALRFQISYQKSSINLFTQFWCNRASLWSISIGGRTEVTGIRNYWNENQRCEFQTSSSCALWNIVVVSWSQGAAQRTSKWSAITSDMNLFLSSLNLFQASKCTTRKVKGRSPKDTLFLWAAILTQARPTSELRWRVVASTLGPLTCSLGWIACHAELLS